MYTMRMEIGTAADVILNFLKSKGYRPVGTISEQTSYIFAVLDYLNNMGDEYTLDDWFRDTKQNYPEDLTEV